MIKIDKIILATTAVVLVAVFTSAIYSTAQARDTKFVRVQQDNWLNAVDTYTLSRNVDGDTVELYIDQPVTTERWWQVFTFWNIWWNRPKLTVRMIGINSPESVDPRRPVECGGKEASVVLRDLLTKYIDGGGTIRLTQDHSQSGRDIFGRILAYVGIVLPNEPGDLSKIIDLNLTMLQLGYAREYTFNKDTPYIRQREYIEAQAYAKKLGLGIWAKGACPPS